MQRISYSKEDRTLAIRWLLAVVAVYSAAVLVIVLIAASFPASHGAGLAALRGPAPGFNKGGLHTRSRTYPIDAARPEQPVFAHR